MYNLGFIGLRRDGKAESLLDWWGRRVYDKCLMAPRAGLFVDQRWIDLVPGLFEGMHILRDPEYNVAYWNLAERTFSYGSVAWPLPWSWRARRLSPRAQPRPRWWRRRA
ncbi:MAG TPA: hypothetical protein VJB36_05355 [Methylomirabilota bacterium]|nr:hypothetical protein [Methylomirabilota bacterium]